MELPLESVLKKFTYLSDKQPEIANLVENLRILNIKLFRDQRNLLIRTSSPLIGLEPNSEYQGYIPVLSDVPFKIITTNDKMYINIPEIELPCDKVERDVFIGLVIIKDRKIVATQFVRVIIWRRYHLIQGYEPCNKSFTPILPVVEKVVPNIAFRVEITLEKALKQYNYLSIHRADIPSTGFANILSEFKIYYSQAYKLKKMEMNLLHLKENTTYYGYLPAFSPEKFKIVAKEDKICFDFPTIKISLPDKPFVLNEMGKRKPGGIGSFVGLVIVDKDENVILGKVVPLITFRQALIKPYGMRECSCFYILRSERLMQQFQQYSQKQPQQSQNNNREELDSNDDERSNERLRIIEEEEENEESSKKQRTESSESISEIQDREERNTVLLNFDVPDYVKFL